MFENDRKDTASKAVTSIRHQNDIEKSTWKILWYFFDFESRIHVEISTSNRCHNFHVDLSFKIDETLTNFPRGISTSNRWRIDEDVSIGKINTKNLQTYWIQQLVMYLDLLLNNGQNSITSHEAHMM